MLTLTRRVGESIRIGQTTCITVYDRLRYHVLIGVLTAPQEGVRFGAEALRAAALPDGNHFYLLTLLSDECFEVGPARVGLRFRPTYLGTTRASGGQVKLDVAAPLEVPVDREEVFLRRNNFSSDVAGLVAFSRWMCRANQSVSTRSVG